MKTILPNLYLFMIFQCLRVNSYRKRWRYVYQLHAVCWCNV